MKSVFLLPTHWLSRNKGTIVAESKLPSELLNHNSDDDNINEWTTWIFDSDIENKHFELDVTAMFIVRIFSKFYSGPFVVSLSNKFSNLL